MDAFRFSRHELARIGMTAVIELAVLAVIQTLAPVFLVEPWRSLAIIGLSAIAIIAGFAVFARWIARPVALLPGPTGATGPAGPTAYVAEPRVAGKTAEEWHLAYQAAKSEVRRTQERVARLEERSAAAQPKTAAPTPLPVSAPPQTDDLGPIGTAPAKGLSKAQGKAAKPEFRLNLSAGPDRLHIVVMNDGPAGKFRGEVRKISSPHFHTEGAERTDWPWPIAWLRSMGETIKIEPARSASLRLVMFDAAGAASQLASRGGYAFQFPGPKDVIGVHGRLGIGRLQELAAERLAVTVRVYRLGPPDIYVERTICFVFKGQGQWCDQESSSPAI